MWLGHEIRFGRAAQPASGTIVEVPSRDSAEGREFYPMVGFNFRTNGSWTPRESRWSWGTLP